jgi:hypothetical protein
MVPVICQKDGSFFYFLFIPLVVPVTCQKYGFCIVAVLVNNFGTGNLYYILS